MISSLVASTAMFQASTRLWKQTSPLNLTWKAHQLALGASQRDCTLLECAVLRATAFDFDSVMNDRSRTAADTQPDAATGRRMSQRRRLVSGGFQEAQ